MKRNLFLLSTLFLIGVLISSCEKDKNSDSARLRIVKIADNQAMENPWFTFEYNTKGLLVNMIERYSSTTFEYDANDRPIKVDPYSIEWNEDGFIQTHPAWSDRKTVYILNSHNQVESEIEFW